MSLLTLILFVEFSVALFSIGIWVIYRSRELEKYVNNTHIDYHFSQDFHDDWAALTMGKIIGTVLVAGGILGSFIFGGCLLLVLEMIL